MNKRVMSRLVPGVACVAALALASCAAPKKTGRQGGEIIHAKAKQAARLVADGQVVVLDIRTPQEFAAGHIGGATNMDFHAPDFAAQLAKLDREQAYLVHCNSGRRSTNALPQFTALRFNHVIHLDGGIKAWAAAGNPVTKP